MPSNEDGARSEWIRQALAEYEGPLIRYAHRITRDREWAREVVQETFLRLCREDPRTIDSHLAKWLFLVCRNKALDVIRKERRMSPLASEHVLESPERNASPDHAAEQRDSAAQVIAFIGDLPGNQQEVLRLKFQDGLSYAEISEVTGLSVSNVGFLLHCGLKSLRQRVLRAERDTATANL